MEEGFANIYRVPGKCTHSVFSSLSLHVYNKISLVKLALSAPVLPVTAAFLCFPSTFV